MKIFLSIFLLLVLFSCSEKNGEVFYPNKFYDNFDKLDDKWELQLYSFEENGANMLDENISVSQSILTIATSSNTNQNLPKPYNGGGMGDTSFYLYGYFEVRMKSDIFPGTVSSFYLMNKWQALAWEHQEIDIEFTGNNLSSMHMTTHHFQNGGTDHKSSTTCKLLGFNISENYHDYGILWTPDSVSWYVDGSLFHTERRFVPQVPLQIRLNHWVGNMSMPYMVDWIGEANSSNLPSYAYYDWIKVLGLEEFYIQKTK